MTITEIKRHVDGREERFTCSLLYRDAQAMVIRFVAQPGSRFHRLMAHSDGFFWVGRPYIMYRIVGHDGAVAGYRFDAARDVRFGHDYVEFTDLLLDFRVAPDGSFTVEDEDELEAALALGVIEETDYDLAYLARELVEAEFAAIAAEAEALAGGAL